MTSPELRETLIEIYLRTMEAVHPTPVNAGILRSACRQAGFGKVLEDRDHDSLLADLIEKGWVKAVASEAAPELKRYQRTEAGRVHLASL